jgi:hypothetical protein
MPSPKILRSSPGYNASSQLSIREPMMDVYSFALSISTKSKESVKLLTSLLYIRSDRNAAGCSVRRRYMQLFYLCSGLIGINQPVSILAQLRVCC